MNTLLTSPRRLARPLAVLAVLTGVIAGLHLLARTGLRGPTGTSRDEISAWLDDPILAVATILRWLALVLAYYLLVVVGLVLLMGERVARTPLKHVVPAGLAPALGLLLGIGAVAAPLVGHMERSGEDVSAPPNRLQLVEVDSLLQLHSLDEAPPPPRPQAETKGPSTKLEGARSQADIWTVETGDSFWRIANENLQDSWDRHDLSDAEVATYWRVLIEANVDRLVEPGNPDLLLPGQELVLPAVPPPQS